jgi:hypothetical protein
MAGGVAQVVDPEFKPQYCKKGEKKTQFLIVYPVNTYHPSFLCWMGCYIRSLDQKTLPRRKQMVILD